MVSKMVSKKPQKSATDLMKKVAETTMNRNKMAKTFTPEEINEIVSKRKAADKAKTEEKDKAELREKYRKIKATVAELEVGNRSKLIVFPTVINEGWYKVGEVSALYYAYRLAPRMGRKARVMRDTDKHSKMQYIVSMTNIEKFVAQFKELEGGEPEITQDGVYIFPLKHELSDEDIAGLRRVEEERRERMHNVLKPKKMSPAAYQAILMATRQILPNARKLSGAYATAVGNRMISLIGEITGTYFNYAEGILPEKEAGAMIIGKVNELEALLAMLSEIKVWDYSRATIMGENLNNLKNIVRKEFKVGNV